jgi:uncharacterized radical SAM superfamily protein
MKDYCRNADLGEIFSESRRIADERFGRKVELYFTYFQTTMLPILPMIDPENHPFVQDLSERYGPVSPIIDLSGGRCELMCEHCDSQYLEGMVPLPTVDELVSEAFKQAEMGTKSLLLSAGSRKNGTTMIDESYYDGLRRIKEETGLYLGIHSGYISRSQAQAYHDIGIDSVLVDVIGDQETLSNVYHIDRPVTMIRETLEGCYEVGINAIPHVCAGLNFGKIEGEYDAIDMLADLPVKYLTYIVLIPTPGTGMENVDPPSVEEVERLIAYSRMKLPETVISLGCVRPLGEHAAQLEKGALEIGCNRIANISSRSTIESCKALELEHSISGKCCMVGDGMFD